MIYKSMNISWIDNKKPFHICQFMKLVQKEHVTLEIRVGFFLYPHVCLFLPHINNLFDFSLNFFQDTYSTTQLCF